MNIFNSINLSNVNSKNKIRIYPPLTNSVKFSQNSRKSKTIFPKNHLMLFKNDSLFPKRRISNNLNLSNSTSRTISNMSHMDYHIHNKPVITEYNQRPPYNYNRLSSKGVKNYNKSSSIEKELDMMKLQISCDLINYKINQIKNQVQNLHESSIKDNKDIIDNNSNINIRINNDKKHDNIYILPNRRKIALNINNKNKKHDFKNFSKEKNKKFLELSNDMSREINNTFSHRNEIIDINDNLKTLTNNKNFKDSNLNKMSDNKEIKPLNNLKNLLITRSYPMALGFSSNNGDNKAQFMNKNLDEINDGFGNIKNNNKDNLIINTDNNKLNKRNNNINNAETNLQKYYKYFAIKQNNINRNNLNNNIKINTNNRNTRNNLNKNRILKKDLIKLMNKSYNDNSQKEKISIITPKFGALDNYFTNNDISHDNNNKNLYNEYYVYKKTNRKNINKGENNKNFISIRQKKNYDKNLIEEENLNQNLSINKQNYFNINQYVKEKLNKTQDYIQIQDHTKEQNYDKNENNQHKNKFNKNIEDIKPISYLNLKTENNNNNDDFISESYNIFIKPKNINKEGNNKDNNFKININNIANYSIKNKCLNINNENTNKNDNINNDINNLILKDENESQNLSLRHNYSKDDLLRNPEKINLENNNKVNDKKINNNIIKKNYFFDKEEILFDPIEEENISNSEIKNLNKKKNIFYFNKNSSKKKNKEKKIKIKHRELCKKFTSNPQHFFTVKLNEMMLKALNIYPKMKIEKK